MDDDLQQLEAELKGLRPLEPSPELLVRLERELKPTRQRTVPGRWIWTSLLSAAAAVATVLMLADRREPGDHASILLHPAAAATLSSAPFQPVAAENVLYAARDEGLVTLSDGTSARRERLNYVETITWKNPRTNALVRWTVPREEVRIVPVNFQ